MYDVIFPKKVKVKLNFLENSELKICESKRKAGPCKKFFNLLDQLFSKGLLKFETLSKLIKNKKFIYNI